MVMRYTDDRYITTTEAMQIASEKGYPVKLVAMINWINKYHLGKKFLGHYRVEKERLLQLLEDGKIEEDRKGTKHQKKSKK